MTEPTRLVSPPPRPRMDASRLLAKNRDADFQAAQGSGSSPATPISSLHSDALNVESSQPLSLIPPLLPPFSPASPGPAPASLPESAKPKRRPNLTIDIDADLRARVRATYLATHDREGEDTFQRMIWKVLTELCERRERDYNAGRRFDVGDAQLRRGRPLR